MWLEFTAYGTPVTQGSVTSYPTKGGRGVRTVSKTPPLIEWREIVRAAAESVLPDEWEVQDGPAKVWLRFFLPRPANRPKTIDVYPSHGKTDIDKYDRAILDSLTNAGVWTDDTRVVDLSSKKRYAVGPDLPRIYKPGVHRTSPRVEVKVLWLD